MPEVRGHQANSVSSRLAPDESVVDDDSDASPLLPEAAKKPGLFSDRLVTVPAEKIASVLGKTPLPSFTPSDLFSRVIEHVHTVVKLTDNKKPIESAKTVARHLDEFFKLNPESEPERLQKFLYHSSRVKEQDDQSKQRRIFEIIYKIIALCQNPVTLDYLNDSLPKIQKEYSLSSSYMQEISKTLNEKSRKIKSTYTRSATGMMKKDARPHWLKLQKRIKLGKYYRFWAEARDKKEEIQKDITKKEDVEKKAYPWAKSSSQINAVYKGDKKYDSSISPHLHIDQALEGFSQLKEHEGMDYSIPYMSGKTTRGTSLVMSKDGYIEHAINPIMYNHCKPVIQGCISIDGLNHIRGSLAQHSKQGTLNKKTARKLHQKLDKQEIEVKLSLSHDIPKKKTPTMKALIKAATDYEKIVRGIEKLEYGKHSKVFEDNITGIVVNRFIQYLKKHMGEEKTRNLLARFRQRDNRSAGLALYNMLRIRDASVKKEKIKAYGLENLEKYLTEKANNIRNHINKRSNQCYISSPEYCSAMRKYTMNTMALDHRTHFAEQNHQAYFRAVSSGPDKVFKQGFMPALLSRLGYQKGEINKPYVNSSAKNETEVGWTGGVVSLSANLLHCASGTYTATTGQQAKSRWVYLTVPDTTASIAQHLDKKADPYALDAKEVIAPSIAKERVIAARKVEPDGSIGDIVWNKDAMVTKDTVNTPEITHFLNATSLADIADRDPEAAFNPYNIAGSALQKPPVVNPDGLIPSAQKERLTDYRNYQAKEKAYFERWKRGEMKSTTSFQELFAWEKNLAENQFEQLKRERKAMERAPSPATSLKSLRKKPSH